MNAANPTTAQARAIVDELCHQGVRHAVVCPGSRSAALALAFAAAAETGALTLHVRIDERAAAFLALGLARGAQSPVPILVTSGTAAANLLPAMVEASETGVPLIAVTANRPPELWGTGANQTIDQVGIYGAHCRAVVSVPVAAQSPQRSWRAHVARACYIATTGATGPVQLDVPATEPLVPDHGDEQWELHDADRSAPITEMQKNSDLGLPGNSSSGARDGDINVAELRLAARPLVVAGVDARVPASLRHLPTVAEPGAPHPEVAIHPLALPHIDPDCVVVVGRPTLHRPVSRLLARDDLPLIVVSRHTGEWFNPGNAPIIGPVIPSPAHSGQPVLEPTQQWRDAVEEATQRAQQAVNEELSKTRANPRGLHVAAAVAAALTAEDMLFVGASNPIRDLSLVPPTSARVVANRGAAGIDGNIATATGLALASGRRTVALLGDLTFLHDIGSLLIGPAEPRPRNLTVVVANDNGGGIFSLLEQGDPRLSQHFERVFGTPHAADLGALCRGYGITHHIVTIDDLPARLDETQNRNGVQVLEVQTQRSDMREAQLRMQKAAEPATAARGSVACEKSDPR